MNIPSEFLQLITILILPVAAIGLAALCWKRKLTNFQADIGVLFLFVFCSLLTNRSYTIFSIGIIKCPDGQRIVEVAPSIFSGVGDQQQCVSDTLASTIAEQLALLRPTIMGASFVAVLSFCMLVFVLKLWRKREDSQMF